MLFKALGWNEKRELERKKGRRSSQPSKQKKGCSSTDPFGGSSYAPGSLSVPVTHTGGNGALPDGRQGSHEVFGDIMCCLLGQLCSLGSYAS